MDDLTPASLDLFADVRSILATARSKAATAVNTATVEAYWLIGKRIVDDEQEGQAKATYGTRLLEELSRHLADQFGKGFSGANLRNFCPFYLAYPDSDEIHYTLRSEFTFVHSSALKDSEQFFASKYRTLLPTEEELAAEIERERPLIEHRRKNES